jgi:hypothetical protein
MAGATTADWFATLVCMEQDTTMEPGGEVEAPAGYDQAPQAQHDEAPPWVAGLERSFAERLGQIEQRLPPPEQEP